MCIAQVLLGAALCPFRVLTEPLLRERDVQLDSLGQLMSHFPPLCLYPLLLPTLQQPLVGNEEIMP